MSGGNTFGDFQFAARARRRALTLIELLVVISIISLLMALLIPALQGIRKRANTVVCQARLREADMIMAAYAQANDGILPLEIGMQKGPTSGVEIGA